MGLFRRLTTLAKSPQGRRLLSEAQKAARDPQNRQRLEMVRDRIQKRGRVAPADRAPEAPPPSPQRSGDAANES